MKIQFSLVLAAALFSPFGSMASSNPTQPSLSGGMDSGGAGLIDLRAMSAWFLESKPVEYCIDRDPNFPTAQDKVEEVVAFAIATWTAKLQSTKRNAKSSQPFTRIEARFELVACDASTDLIFLFGGDPSIVPEAIKNDPRIWAFADTLQRSKSKSWNKGYVYFKSDLPLPYKVDDGDYKLTALALHEVGHVFGTGHIPKTVMDQNILHYIARERTPSDPSDWIWTTEQRRTIDHGHTLNSNNHLSTLHKNSAGVDQTMVFKHIQKPDGNSFGNFQVTLTSRIGSQEMRYLFTPNRVHADPESLVLNHRIFYAYVERSDGTYTSSLPYEAIVIEGVVTASDGNTYAGSYAKNSGGLGHRLAIFKDGAWTTLFKQ